MLQARKLDSFRVVTFGFAAISHCRQHDAIEDFGLTSLLSRRLVSMFFILPKAPQPAFLLRLIKFKFFYSLALSYRDTARRIEFQKDQPHPFRRIRGFHHILPLPIVKLMLLQLLYLCRKLDAISTISLTKASFRTTLRLSLNSRHSELTRMKKLVAKKMLLWHTFPCKWTLRELSNLVRRQQTSLRSNESMMATCQLFSTQIAQHLRKFEKALQKFRKCRQRRLYSQQRSTRWITACIWLIAE